MTLRNFRCFGDSPTTVTLAEDITALVGANGSGEDRASQCADTTIRYNAEHENHQRGYTGCWTTCRRYRRRGWSSRWWGWRARCRRWWGGLVRAPVIAVPTSVGYGASLGGVAALLAMLNSCAPGVAVVNIDNGFGAGYLAAVIAKQGKA